MCRMRGHAHSVLWRKPALDQFELLHGHGDRFVACYDRVSLIFAQVSGFPMITSNDLARLMPT